MKLAQKQNGKYYLNKKQEEINMTKRIFLILATVMLLLGAFAINAAATDELADVYVATTGIDTNAGTAEAPVLSLNKALELVQNGGTVHIVDACRTSRPPMRWSSRRSIRRISCISTAS